LLTGQNSSTTREPIVDTVRRTTGGPIGTRFALEGGGFWKPFQTEKGIAMNTFSSDSASGEQADDSGKVDRTHELTWALIDESITDAEMSELEELLRTDTTARESYTRCMQLHAELAWHFTSPAKRAPVKKSTPILGFLSPDVLTTGIDSPTTGETR
jgi:hypothetical protein